MQIRGLFISSSTVLIAALYDTLSFKFKIATVNFSSINIFYQETFPDFVSNTIRRVVFLTDSLYFLAANLINMNTNIAAVSS